MNFSEPEHELLVCCAKTDFKPVEQRVACLLEKSLDWGALVGLASRHGVVSLLYRNLHPTFDDNIPANIRDALKQLVQDNARRNLLLTSKLMQILTRLEEAQIEAMPFKGPALAMELYHDVALREFVDLDVLVHEQDVPQARQVLKSLGYRQDDDYGDKEEHDQAHDLYNHFFTAADGTHAVELHWRLAKPHFAHLSNTFSFWEGCEPARFFNLTIRRPRPENMLMYLCAHGARHRWMRLAWLVDLAEFLRVYPAMDWDYILAQSARQRSTRVLLIGLALAHEMLGTALPEAIQPMLRRDRHAISQFTQEIQSVMFEEHTSPPIDNEVYAFHIRMRESWLDRLIYLRYPLRKKVKPGPKDVAMIVLPESLSFLYYVLRPIRLLVTYGTQKIRGILKAPMSTTGSKP